MGTLVGQVILFEVAGAVDFESFKIFSQLRIWLLKQVVACQHRPSVQFSRVLQSSKKPIFFAPNKVMVFGLHAEEVDSVSVGEGLHLDGTKVFDEGDSFQSGTVVQMVVDASDDPTQLVKFNLAVLDHALHVVHK